VKRISTQHLKRNGAGLWALSEPGWLSDANTGLRVSACANPKVGIGTMVTDGEE